MQLSQDTLSKFGLGRPEVTPSDPTTHIPTIGVGSNILYSNNPSSTAVYDPNADGSFMKDLNTGADIRPNGSNVFNYKAPKQIATAKSNSASSLKPTNPFLNTGTVKNSFTATVNKPRPKVTTSSASGINPPRVINNTSSGIKTGLVRSTTNNTVTKKPSIASQKLVTAAKPTINNLFTTINKIIGNIIGRR